MVLKTRGFNTPITLKPDCSATVTSLNLKNVDISLYFFWICGKIPAKSHTLPQTPTFIDNCLSRISNFLCQNPEGGASFVDHLCYFCLILLCFHVCLFVGALWSPARKRLTFVMSNCDVVTFPLVSWVRCGAWLYRFLIFALFLTL